MTPPAPGPVYVCGRQHSGNAVLVLLLGRIPGCYAAMAEGWFFEHRRAIERIRDPDRRAPRVVDVLQLQDDELTGRLRPWLGQWHRRHPQATAVELYRQAMDFAASAAGKRFWVRRATSYIFYAAEILASMPDARLIYLLRNPFDIAASEKRRAPRIDRFGALALSWNRGLRIAQELAASRPRRVLIVRYEELVSRPREVLPSILEFVGVPFDESYLEVDHVNTPDDAARGAGRGLNPSRVHHYPGVLRGPEIAAVQMAASTSLLRRHYPDLPHGLHVGAGARIAGLGLLALSPLAFAAQQVRLMLKLGPLWRLRRLWHRVGVSVRRN